MEAIGLIAFFAILVELTTSELLSAWTLVVCAGMVSAAAWCCADSDARKRFLPGGLGMRSAALAGGFWLFAVFRFLELVQWPLARAADLTGYARLLYCHFVLSLSVLTPLVITGGLATEPRNISWGVWTRDAYSILGRSAWGLAAGIWIWTIFQVGSLKPQASGPIAGLLIIALLKAALTGATEEICFRGLIQPAAIARFGIPAGIVLQSCLYTLFHLHLTAIFLPRGLFLAGVMAIGLLFGAATRLTQGIGWAVVMHTGISLVIEWHNLS
jgi:membrane protease YdiL (CAAX protease family)